MHELFRLQFGEQVKSYAMNDCLGMSFWVVRMN